jgi:hypothetical protein
MPLHDWSRLEGWQGVHHFWMGEITRDLNANLPAGYKAVIGGQLLELSRGAPRPQNTPSQTML